MLNKVRKTIASGLLAAVIAGLAAGCGNNLDSPVLTSSLDNPVSTFGNVDQGAPFKMGMIIDDKTPRVKYDEESGVLKNAGIPSHVDWRQFASPVANQGQLGSCTGFAIVKGMREFLMIRDKQPLVPLSPLFLYYHERKISGTIDQDSGSRISTGVKLLKDLGTSTEDTWTYDDTNDNNPLTKEKFQVSPAREAFSTAGDFRVRDIKPLEGLRDIKYALAKENPVVFGMIVYDDLFYTKDGTLPPPNLKKKSEGGHAVFAVGYDDNKKVLIIKNSWSSRWGDKGYFYLPYEYVKQGLVFDAWTAFTR
jgi:C1A family cysteine protease